MMRMLMVRGLLCGVVAGLVSYVFTYLFGEPPLRGGIAFEEAAAVAQGEPPAPEIVSRAVQETFGLGIGVLAYALAFGGLFALAFASAHGRVGRMDARGTVIVVAAVGFVSAVVVPALKYPANPPAVSDPDTLNDRTLAYLAMLVLSVALAAAALYLRGQLLPRFAGCTATVLAAGVYLSAVGVVAALLPAVREMPEGFPAMVVWDFRVAALGAQLVMWTTFALLFGALVERQLARIQRAAQRAAALA